MHVLETCVFVHAYVVYMDYVFEYGVCMCLQCTCMCVYVYVCAWV